MKNPLDIPHQDLVKIIQQAVSVPDDGILGPQTVRAVADLAHRVKDLHAANERTLALYVDLNKRYADLAARAGVDAWMVPADGAAQVREIEVDAETAAGQG
jgi:lysozyme family protein